MSRCPYCHDRTSGDLSDIRRHVLRDCWVIQAKLRELAEAASPVVPASRVMGGEERG